MAPAEAGRDATKRMPRGTFRFLPGIGHFPFLEAPETTARLIRELVADDAARERR
jgi:pimeloyl-ACP methyl ester carboxylesterase